MTVRQQHCRYCNVISTVLIYSASGVLCLSKRQKPPLTSESVLLIWTSGDVCVAGLWLGKMWLIVGKTNLWCNGAFMTGRTLLSGGRATVYFVGKPGYYWIFEAAPCFVRVHGLSSANSTLRHQVLTRLTHWLTEIWMYLTLNLFRFSLFIMLLTALWALFEIGSPFRKALPLCLPVFDFLPQSSLRLYMFA